MTESIANCRSYQHQKFPITRYLSYATIAQMYLVTLFVLRSIYVSDSQYCRMCDSHWALDGILVGHRMPALCCGGS